MKRWLYIGDVHGCREELEQLLERAAFEPAADRLALVGDLVDRGPDSPGVVRLCRQLAELHGAVVVRGNHEHAYVRYRHRLAEAGGARERVKMRFPESKQAIYDALEPADLDWLEELPWHAEVGGLLVVHAGVCPRRHRTRADLDTPRYRERLIRLRHVDAEGRQVALGAESAETHHWASAYDGRLGTIVYGHDPRDDVRFDEHAIGIDTSCCFGGRLTALVREEGGRTTEVSVPALATYSARRVIEE